MKPTVVLVVAIIALIIGAAGLYYGLASKESLQKLETSLATVETDVGQLKADAGQTDAKIRALKDEVYANLNTLNNNIQIVHQEISDFTNKVFAVKQKESDKTGEGKKGAEREGKAEKMAKPADGLYTIQAGDSVGKIAKQFGVTKNAIFVANPTLDPNKLKSGKKIRIP